MKAVQVPVTVDTFRGRAAVNATTACRQMATVGGKAEIGKVESRSEPKARLDKRTGEVA